MSEPRVLGGRYELGNVVGRGGMAEVHHGRDIRLERDVAVKTLRTDLARDPTFQARFRREAQSAAQLNHPAVVAVYDTGEEMVDSTATPYIVMEYVEGQTLRDVLQDTQRLMPDRALDVTAGVLKALSYSHRMGIVHRDIKPANVMLTQAGEIKVMDFGIARSVSDAQATMTQTAQVIGTAQYLSPEQARGEKVDARSDLYSTGCVLYELLTGGPPFSGDSPVSVAYQHVREDPTPPSHLNPDVPPAVDAIVLKALAKNPDNRYANADDMRADIERALGGLPVHATPVLDNDATEYLGGAGPTALMDSAGDNRGPGHRRKKKSRKALFFTLLAFGLVIALILGLLAWGAISNDNDTPARVSVPDVVGDAVGVATSELKESGFKVATKEQFSKKVAEGNVISQDPEAKKKANKGSTVTLLVSKGEKQVTVPPLVGKKRKKAIEAIEAAGLEVGQVSRDASARPKGTVLSSDPSSGERVPDGSSVNIVVSTGTVEVPDVIGESEGEAKAELTQLDFRVNTVYQETSDAEPGEVIAQSPDGGSQAAKGSQVTITVAEEPEEPTDEPTTQTPTSSPSPSETCTPQPFC